MTAPPSTRSTGGRRWRLVRAHPDAVPYSVRRFTRRARQRRMRVARPWALVAAVLLLAASAGWVTYGTSLLGVREVRVTGTEILTVEQVREAAALRAGAPLARVDLSAVRERVARLVPVDHATVRRDWPHTIVVEVTERTAVAAVPQGKQFVLVDRAGVAFDTVAARPPGLPTVTVKSGADTRAGIQVLASLTPRLREELVSVTVNGPARISLVLTGHRKVVWGDATQSDRKAKVATALLERADGAGDDDPLAEGKTLDVSAPDVVTIR
jgi:cell division protein FtsQ